MGHEINMDTFPAKMTIEEIEARVKQMVAQCGNRHHTGYGTTKVKELTGEYESYEDAAAALEKATEGEFYGGAAVRYHALPRDAKPSAARVKLMEQYKAAQAARAEFTKKKSVLNYTADFIGCKNCGSKVARKFLHSDFCPVCHSDLRTQSTRDAIEAKIKKEQDIEAKVQEQIRKESKKAPLMWLVRWENNI